jgi:hypothetical protein
MHPLTLSLRDPRVLLPPRPTCLPLPITRLAHLPAPDHRESPSPRFRGPGYTQERTCDLVISLSFVNPMKRYAGRPSNLPSHL